MAEVLKLKEDVALLQLSSFSHIFLTCCFYLYFLYVVYTAMHFDNVDNHCNNVLVVICLWAFIHSDRLDLLFWAVMLPMSCSYYIVTTPVSLHLSHNKKKTLDLVKAQLMKL